MAQVYHTSGRLKKIVLDASAERWRAVPPSFPRQKHALANVEAGIQSSAPDAGMHQVRTCAQL